MLYNTNTPNQTTITTENVLYQGETIEQKINRIVNNKEPITDGAPLIYTERKLGVQPAYNIRTDRWEIAIDAMDAISASHRAKRTSPGDLGDQAKEGMKKEGDQTPGDTKLN